MYIDVNKPIDRILELFLKNANCYTDSLNSVPAMDINDFLKVYPEFLQKIDWSLLRVQKQELINISDFIEASHYPIKSQIDTISGIISLIDTIQDYSVDVMGLSETEIFNLSEEK